MPAEWFGLFAVAAAAAGVLTLAARRRLPGRAAAALCAAFLLPLDGLPLAAYVRGALGDPSFGTLTLIGAALVPGLRPTGGDGRRLASLLVVLAAGGLLYPLALGAGGLDPYRWGFGSSWFVAAVLALATLAYGLRWPLVPTAVGLAVLAWSLGIYESRNLWDYLLDPLLALYALCVFPGALWRWLAARREERRATLRGAHKPGDRPAEAPAQRQPSSSR